MHRFTRHVVSFFWVCLQVPVVVVYTGMVRRQTSGGCGLHQGTYFTCSLTALDRPRLGGDRQAKFMSV